MLHGNNDFDPQFVDTAWDEMQTMLDKELPVGEVVGETRFHKRHLVFLLLLIGLSSGITWNYCYKMFNLDSNTLVKNMTKEHLTKPTLLTEEAVTTKKSKHKNLATQTEQFTKTQAETVAQKTDELSKGNGFFKAKEYAQKNKSSLKDKPSNHLALSELIKTTVGLLEDHKKITKSPSTVLDPQLSQKIMTLEELPVPKDSKSILGAITKIPILEMDFLFDRIEKISMHTAPEKLSLLQHLIPDKIGLEMGLFSPNLNKFNAWKVGLGLAYKLGPRIELRTGLNFEQYQKDITYAYSEDVDDLAASSIGEPAYAIEHNDPFGNTSYFEPGNETENLVLKTKYFRLDQIQYFSLPVVVSLYPSRFWSVNLGARFARAGKVDGTVLSGNIEQEKKLANVLLKEGQRKMNTSMITGLTIHPHKNIGLNLNYNFAIGDVIKEGRLRVTDGKNMNNTFEVSLNWYLFGK